MRRGRVHLRQQRGGVKVSTSESFDFSGGGTHWGWKWAAGLNNYLSDSEFLEEGVYCIDGNVEISKDLGSPGNPHEISILSTKSVKLSSNSYVATAHSDSIFIIAEEDLMLSGSPTGGNDSFEGLTYGGAQCQISGTARLHGHFICADNPNPSGSIDWAPVTKFSGDAEIRYSCGGLFGGAAAAAPISGRMWSHVW